MLGQVYDKKKTSMTKRQEIMTNQQLCETNER